MSDEQGMATGTVIAKLRSGATDAEAGEALTFSQRYAMREAADRLARLEAENARMRAVVEAVAKGCACADERMGEDFCAFCGSYMDFSEPHARDCLMLQARAILASASDGATNEPPA